MDIAESTNKDGTYLVRLPMNRPDAAAFLLQMWRSVDHFVYPYDEDQALLEWTDRGRGVRSYYQAGCVVILTHSGNRDDDGRPLPDYILGFIRGYAANG